MHNLVTKNITKKYKMNSDNVYRTSVESFKHLGYTHSFWNINTELFLVQPLFYADYCD